MSTRRPGRRIVIPVLLTMVASFIGVTPAAAATPTFLWVTTSANPAILGDPITLTFTVRPNPGAGTVHIRYDLRPPYAYVTGDIPLGSNGTATHTVLRHASYLAVGTTQFTAQAMVSASTPAFEDSPVVTWDQVVIETPAVPIVTVWAASNPPDTGTPVRVSASVSRTTSSPAPSSGTIAFQEAGQTLATAPVVAGKATASVGLLAAGPHTFTATYSDPGGTVIASSTPVVVDVLAEVPRDTTVGAHGLAITPTTFYPVKDGYLDTLTIKGVLDEAGTVSAAIYSVATGRKVRVFTLGSRTGAYSLKWDGRNSSGILQPAGKYRVSQTARDAAGNKLTKTSVAALSLKRAYMTTRTVTLDGSQYTKYRVARDAFVSLASSFPRGIHIYAPLDDPVAVWWGVYLPKAPVYGTIKFSVLGDGSSSNFRLGIWKWVQDEPGELDGQRQVGDEYAWYSTSVPAAGHVLKHGLDDGYVVGMLESGYPSQADFQVAKVRITYSYGYLR